MTKTQKNYLEIHGINKSFGRLNVLKDVSFSMETGSLLSILGPSGCGKSTLLRIIAGLETQDSGFVKIMGNDVSDRPVSHRNVGIVFQSYALFPNLTVEQNIAYGLASADYSKRQINERVAEMLELVSLTGMEKKYPATLSGGQQQRVALARALAISPDLLLLDEPLSALDAKVRNNLRGEIKRLQKQLNLTTIMVTHDQEEALTMADTIIVMDQGEIAQTGCPMTIYEKPETPFVASFIGSMNFIGDVEEDTAGRFRIGDLALTVTKGKRKKSFYRGAAAIRPEDVWFPNGTITHENNIEATIKDLEFRGQMSRLALEIEAGERVVPLSADIPTEKVMRLNLKADGRTWIHLPPERIHLFKDYDPEKPGPRPH